MLQLAWSLVAAQYSAALLLKALRQHRYAKELLEGVGISLVFLIFFSSFDALVGWVEGFTGISMNWDATMKLFDSLQGDVSSLMWAVIYSTLALAGAYAIASLIAGVSFIGLPAAVALNFTASYVLGALNASARIVSMIYVLTLLIMFFVTFACFFAKPLFIVGAAIFPFHFTRRVGVTLMVFSLVTYVGFPIIAASMSRLDGSIAPFFNNVKHEAEAVEFLKNNSTRVKLSVVDRVGKPVIFPYVFVDKDTNISAGRWINGTEVKTLLLRGSHSVEAWFLGLYHHVNQSIINVDGPTWDPDDESATDWSRAWRNAQLITIRLDRIDLVNNGTFIVLWDPRLEGSSGSYDINLTLPVTSYSYEFVNKTEFNNKTNGDQTWTYYLTYAEWNASDVIYFAHLNNTRYSFKVSTPSEVNLAAREVEASPQELIGGGYVEGYGQLEVESQWAANASMPKLVADPKPIVKKLILDGSLAKTYNSSSPVEVSSRTIVVHVSFNAGDEALYVPPASFEPYQKEGLPSWALYNRDSLVAGVNLSTMFWGGLQEIYNVLSGFFMKLATAFTGFIAVLVGADFGSRTLGGLSLSGKVISFAQNPGSKLGKPLKHVKKKAEKVTEKGKESLKGERDQLRKDERRLLEEKRRYEHEIAQAARASDEAHLKTLRTGQHRVSEELQRVEHRIDEIDGHSQSMQYSSYRDRSYHVKDVLGAARYSWEGADGLRGRMRYMDQFIHSRAGHDAGRAVIASGTGLSLVKPSVSYVKAPPRMMNDYLRSQLEKEVDRAQREIDNTHGEQSAETSNRDQAGDMRDFTFTYTTRKGVERTLTVKADDLGTAEFIAEDWLKRRDALEELGDGEFTSRVDELRGPE